MRLILLAAICLAACSAAEQSNDSRPNILLIVADDLGYSEVGVYGGEIETPTIDRLAETGVRYSRFYAHSNCSPTRAMLFSGMDNHLAGLGAMRVSISPNQKGQPGYEGYLNHRTVSFTKLLQDSGYKTYMTGKWHLGQTPETLPAARGFDRYFALTKGGPPGGHFNLNGARPGAKGVYFEDGVDRTGTPVTDDFFSSDFYADKLIEYLESAEEDASPFFAYLSFTAPHIPVQAPDSYIKHYRGRYDEGYDVVRQRRLHRMQRLGLVEIDATSGRRAPTVMPWDSLSAEDQQDHARRMEVYAGAIDNMDDNIGRVLSYLRDTDQFENTLILFMSDNGAAGFNGWQSKPLLRQYNAADNSLENLGRDGSMMFYGPGWASAGSAPFYLFKRHMSEGGIRVPFIVTGPGVKHEGSISHELLTVRDIAPTILEIAGIQYPSGAYDGREILPQTGESFARQLAANGPTIHTKSEVFGWELFQRRGVIKGDWKLLWLDSPFGEDQWQLFNLSVDPGETIDLADKEADKLEEMITAWDTYAAENNVIIGDGPLILP